MTTDKEILNLTKKVITNLKKDKPFSISHNKEKHYINRETVDKLKNHAENVSAEEVINHIKTENVAKDEKSGGILFTTLLGLIFGGISAASALAGGTAGIVKAANDKAKNDLELKEQQRHNKFIEDALRDQKHHEKQNGKGIFLNPYKGRALKDILDPIVDKIDKAEKHTKKQIHNKLQKLSPYFKIFEEKNGSGIFLSPR